MAYFQVYEKFAWMALLVQVFWMLRNPECDVLPRAKGAVPQVTGWLGWFIGTKTNH